MLQKKTCVVVGGARGRGEGLVEEYAGRNYYVAFMDTDQASGNRLKWKIEQKYGRKVFFFHGDAGSEEDRELFAGAVIGQYKRVDRLYYRADIAEGADTIAALLQKHLRRGGIVEAIG